MFMGGEFLPGFRSGEVEIARVSIKSTTYDVNSIRAKMGGTRIRYRFYDEYDGETTTGKTSRTSIRPLTLGELLDFMFRAHHFFKMLDRNFPGKLEEQLKFFRGESEFYPKFHDALVEKTTEHFFSKHCTDDEESMENIFQSAPHPVEEKKASSGCKRRIPGLPSWIEEASVDDPIYTRGFVFGGTYSSRSRKNDPVKTKEPKKEPMTIEEEYEEAMLRLAKEKAPKPETEQ